jgi:hypothetical protein
VSQMSLLPPPPGSDDELRALYSGRPRVYCTRCGAMAAEGSVCPRSIRCPTCGRGPGQRCRRPSGHDAADMHATRWQAAESIDRRCLRNAAGGGAAGGPWFRG